MMCSFRIVACQTVQHSDTLRGPENTEDRAGSRATGSFRAITLYGFAKLASVARQSTACQVASLQHMEVSKGPRAG